MIIAVLMNNPFLWYNLLNYGLYLKMSFYQKLAEQLIKITSHPIKHHNRKIVYDVSSYGNVNHRTLYECYWNINKNKKLMIIIDCTTHKVLKIKFIYHLFNITLYSGTIRLENLKESVLKTISEFAEDGIKPHDEK